MRCGATVRHTESPQPVGTKVSPRRGGTGNSTKRTQSFVKQERRHNKPLPKQSAKRRGLVLAGVLGKSNPIPESHRPKGLKQAEPSRAQIPLAKSVCLHGVKGGRQDIVWEGRREGMGHAS